MAVDEQARLELLDAARAALGPRPAGTLMTLLPLSEATELATRSDLHALAERFDAKLDLLRQELLAAFRDELNRAITAQTRTMFASSVASALSTGGLVLAATRLTGG